MPSTIRVPALALAAALSLFPSPSSAQRAVAGVDCARGESIARALQRHPRAIELVVEIRGMCRENVVVTRDRVTLRGGDPSQDGIEAEVSAGELDAVVWVRGAHQVTIENLRLTGGYAGVLATEASTLYLRLANLRVDTNVRYGIELQESLVRADGVVVSGNGISVGAFGGSRFECGNCQLLDPLLGQAATVRTNVIGATGSAILIQDSTVVNGGLLMGNATLTVSSSTISAFGNGAAVVNNDSQASLSRVEVTGHVTTTSGGTTQLLGVTQPAVMQPNNVDSASFLRVAEAAASEPSILRNTAVRNFSSVTVTSPSQITGNLSCSTGGNAFCQNASSNVTGTANCALCTKP
jgi:hypothetical protein